MNITATTISSPAIIKPFEMNFSPHKMKTIATYKGTAEDVPCEFEDGNYGIFNTTNMVWKVNPDTGHIIFNMEEMTTMGWMPFIIAGAFWIRSRIPVPVCDCGCDKTYGPRNTIHADYCSKYPLTKK